MIWGSRTQTTSSRADPDDSASWLTWGSRAERGSWRIGDVRYQLRRAHPAGVVHTDPRWLPSSRYLCNCGLPFWFDNRFHSQTGEIGGLGRYCCKACVATLGGAHDTYCTMHY